MPPLTQAFAGLFQRNLRDHQPAGLEMIFWIVAERYALSVCVIGITIDTTACVLQSSPAGSSMSDLPVEDWLPWAWDFHLLLLIPDLT
jgi:hypothetical protein